MSLFQLNRRKGHKFLISACCFGFCMARILTCSLRMGWATHHDNISLAIAAQIFLSVGILIIYIVNLILAQRILRARQPPIGWHRFFRILFIALYLLVFVFLVLVITFVVIQFYTLDQHLKQVCLDIQRAGVTYFLIVTVLPLFFLALAFAMPRHPNEQNFGKDESSLEFKAVVLLVSTLLCITNAGFKAGVTWETPRPASDPAWYDSKAAFYCFYFALEILIIYWLLTTRIDQRFHVPNGSSKVRTYRTPDERPKSVELVQSRSSADGDKETNV